MISTIKSTIFHRLECNFIEILNSNLQKKNTYKLGDKKSKIIIKS